MGWDSSIGRAFLKVSTGYEPTPSDTILTQMNNLAHFAADVLGDKYQIFDILPICACALDVPVLALTPFAVTWAPTWLPGIGQKVKYGEQWKKQLHATAQTTVTIMQESKVRPAPRVSARSLAHS